MSKERLEEIEGKYTILTVYSEQDGLEYTEVVVEDLVFLIQNGFKQAERVQELERENKRIRQMKYYEAYEQGKFDTNMKVWYEMPKLEQQNKRYREALELLNKVSASDMKDEQLTSSHFVLDITGDALEGDINERHQGIWRKVRNQRNEINRLIESNEELKNVIWKIANQFEYDSTIFLSKTDR